MNQHTLTSARMCPCLPAPARSERGLTLMEILLVIVLIGLMSAFAIPKLTDAMRRQNVAHEHRSLRFRVTLTSGETVEYRPDVVARRGTTLFLVEPLREADDAARIELLERFLDQHSPEIVLVVLAEEDAMGRGPAEAYHELADPGDIAAAVWRIRLQEPGGIIRPFPKPRSGAGL